ncbi:hypothetical protein F5Y09DRAFT_308794 [Xylaria sp. FL1042]|nr:hypothetical protein F5Y09DRAFT_308794 [Xylaria sp. FL1042]
MHACLYSIPPCPNLKRYILTDHSEQMPDNAAEACKDFQVLLDWWMEKIDLKADEVVERRARDRVLEMRDDIP